MKKAKFALAMIFILSILGGAMAYKANRTRHLFYTEITTTTFNSVQTTICTVPTQLSLVLRPFGVITAKVSTAPIYDACPVLSFDIDL